MLNQNLSYKPLDFGNGLVAGSVNDRGQLVALNTANPDLGWATLTGAPPFPNNKWYDQAFVRAYRAGLASPDLPAFGFSLLEATNPTTDCSFPSPAMPQVRVSYPGGFSLQISSFAPWNSTGKPVAAAVQLAEIKLPDNLNKTVNLQFSGNLAFVRAAYSQLTEGGPLLLTPPDYHFAVVDGILAIENAGINQAVALIVGEIDGTGRINRIMADWKVSPADQGQTLKINLPLPLINPEESALRLAAIYGFGQDREEVCTLLKEIAANPPASYQSETAQRWQAIDTVLEAGLSNPEAAWLVRQALAYNLACCPVPVGEDAICIITDHQLLPLSWNRDAYWQVQAYLALRKAAQDPRVPADVTKNVTVWVDGLIKRHLIWLFEIAEQPEDFWGRAYLTNGKCKDLIFQLDQQCYPFLELADYIEVSRDQALVERLKPRIDSCLEFLLARKAPGAWLFPTSETAADDKVDMPYNFSSQLTVLRVLDRLYNLKLVEGIYKNEFLEIVAAISADIYKNLTAEFEGRQVFAYLTDLEGNYQFYHDSNDWPTVFAPAWNFCRVDNQTWLNTLDFAFSPANARGFYPGPMGGLGSIHSPHPWPLGSIQELYLAHLFQDQARYDRTWDRLTKMACWDGNFPEATDATTGKVASRHWFGWPGAMLCLVLLGK